MLVWRVILANIKQAKKRLRQEIKRHHRNVSRMSMMKTFIKKTVNQIKLGDIDLITTAFSKAQSVIDGCVNRGCIHRNKAARYKSRLFSMIAVYKDSIKIKT